MRFDKTAAARRIERFWALQAEFGLEHSAYHTYLNEIVSDRYVLVNGMQLLHDELQLSAIRQPQASSDILACGADMTLPSVLTTLAHTNCGDRIHQGEAMTTYEQVVGTRFACMSEIGESKIEAFSPTGGGTDDGHTLAHVTVAHQLDASIRKALYDGNAQSFVLVNIDLKTHVGRLDGPDGMMSVGITQESRWREPRAACGAIVGTLRGYNPENAVHRRIRDDLGEANYALLSTRGVRGTDGIDLTMAVAAAIVAVQGMLNTAAALEEEFDERGVGHVTASITVNRPHFLDTIIYLGRATVFDGIAHVQGFGVDASKYRGRIVEHHGDKRILLTYDGVDAKGHPTRTSTYSVRCEPSFTHSKRPTFGDV